MFDLLGLNANSYPFSDTSSDLVGSAAYTKALALITKAGIAKATQLWRAEGTDAKGDVVMVTTSLLLNDELRSEYINDVEVEVGWLWAKRTRGKALSKMCGWKM